MTQITEQADVPKGMTTWERHKKAQQWRTARLIVERKLREREHRITPTPDELKRWIAEEHAALFGKPSWWRRLLSRLRR